MKEDEIIEQMIANWGKEKTAEFCTMGAFWCRMRNNTEREKWLLDKAWNILNIENSEINNDEKN